MAPHCWPCLKKDNGHRAVARLVDADVMSNADTMTYTCTPCTLNILAGLPWAEQPWMVSEARSA